MATDMGRGIIAPDNQDNIGTGASEMRTLAATTSAAIDDVSSTLQSEVDQRVRKDYALDTFLPRDEAVRYGIEGRPGKDGEQGPPGLPAAGAIPEDTAVAAFLESEDSQTGTLSRLLFPDRVHTPTASATSVEYWVAKDGDDGNEGSADYPLATLGAAVSRLPNVIRADHQYTIILAPGEWNEQLSLGHLTVQGTLTIKGSSGDRDRHKIYRLRGDTVIGHLRIEHITTTVKNASGPSFWFERCPYVEVENCVVESDPAIEKTPSGVIGLLADYGSNVFVTGSHFTGKRYGMRANYLSRIFSRDNTGENNTFGLGARWGGILSTHGTQPEGDTMLTNSSGGIITHEHGAKLGVKDGYGLIEEASHGDRAPVSRKYAIRSVVTGISEIPANHRLRIRVKARSYGYCMIDAKYGGQVNSSAGQGIQRQFGFVFRSSLMSSQSATTVFSHSMADTDMTLEHTGAEGEVDLIITPQTALSGRWGIDLGLSLMTQQEAPEVTSVTLEPR